MSPGGIKTDLANSSWAHVGLRHGESRHEDHYGGY